MKNKGFKKETPEDVINWLASMKIKVHYLIKSSGKN
jgi:hypothetical protein